MNLARSVPPSRRPETALTSTGHPSHVDKVTERAAFDDNGPTCASRDKCPVPSDSTFGVMRQHVGG